MRSVLTRPGERGTSVAVAAVLLAYPLLVHLAVVLDEPGWAIAACFGLIGLAGAAVAANRRARWWLVPIGAAVLVAAVAWLSTFENVMYVPPVLVNLGLLAFFGRTLSRGRVPLVTRFETLMNGEPGPAGRRYTRRVTEAWTIFFAVMTVECIALALLASPHVWSLFTNFLNYLAAACLFLAEYAIRPRYLSDRAHPGFLPFCRRLSAVFPRAG